MSSIAQAEAAVFIEVGVDTEAIAARQPQVSMYSGAQHAVRVFSFRFNYIAPTAPRDMPVVEDLGR